MIDFIIIYATFLAFLIASAVVIVLSAIVLLYTYNLVRLALSEKWATLVVIIIAVLIYAFILSLGIYFGEEPL